MAPDDRHAPYFREALEHAGVLHTVLSGNVSEHLRSLDVLLLCGSGHLSPAMSLEVSRWVEQGGRLVCAGSTWGLDSLLGVEPHPVRHPSNDLIHPIDGDHPWWPPGASAARFFGGVYATPAPSVSAPIMCGEFVGASLRSVGQGSAFLLAAHVGQTLSLMQMGRAVESDAIGPNDGSARLDDGCLRAEDGTVLSFETDRAAPVGAPHPYFPEPHADVIKEVWLRMIFDAVESAGQTLVLLWPWPDGAQGVVSMAVECDSTEPHLVYGLRRLFEMYGASVCWYVTTQGFPLDVYRSMRKWGDDVGLLFVTDDGSGWQEDKLKVQAFAVNRQASVSRLNPARPIDGRWRGLTTFYDLAEAAGARVSSSKGGRQTGTSGFLFGTCHPFFPVRRDGSSYYILELPQQLHDPGTTTPDPIADRLLDSVAQRYGCLGATVLLSASGSATGLSATQRLVVQARQRQLGWLPAGALYEFEKARRALKWARPVERNAPSVHLTSDGEIEGLHVLFLGRGFEVEGGTSSPQAIQRYGRSFVSISLDLGPKSRAELKIVPSEADAQAA